MGTKSQSIAVSSVPSNWEIVATWVGTMTLTLGPGFRTKTDPMGERRADDSARGGCGVEPGALDSLDGWADLL